VASCTPAAPVAGNSYVETTCNTVAKGQTPDTLADVAEYYWKTDLRDPLLLPDRCTGGPVVVNSITGYNNVCTNTTDYPKQYMKTYTLGLGASGVMQYDENYLTATSGDFHSVEQGVTADPATGVCPWQPNGQCNWPKPESNEQTNIDDLWHAAVNGRGKYFSAGDPASLANGISQALGDIPTVDGALAAVTVSNPNFTSGENSIYEVSFTVWKWGGELVKRTINGTTGAFSTSNTWSAQAKLDAKVSSGSHSARNIYTYDASATNKLKSFEWANLSTTEKTYFTKPHIALLSQFCSTGTICLSPATQLLADEENMVNFLRGEKVHEGAPIDLSAYYRQREHLLGDIVGSEAVYVQAPPWNYADNGYAAFKTLHKTTTPRTAMIYIGANDGMLHAFTESTGEEAWAYIPLMLMPTLHKLADKNYPTAHQYFVDGTPVMGDICTTDCTAAAVWKTILVGGLNNGGRGYYALDITDPATPKAMWEFTDSNLGYTFGNPIITKLKDGTWVVIISSGYNNVSPGDGLGRLYVLNADTGALIRSISTGAGSTTTPSGLSRITAWANFPDSNNTAQRVYGGDLLGNLWRFDVNGDIPSIASPQVYVAQRLATLKDANGVAQPITSKPELAKVKNAAVVFVGTGQLLGSDDLSTTQSQSMYAIKDRLVNDDYGSPRPLSPAQTSPVPGTFIAQTLSTDTCDSANGGFCTVGDAIVNSTNNAVNFTLDDGWYTDFPVAGERVNTDLNLTQGTLAVNTNTPTLGACKPVGSSFAYYLDYRTGGPIEGTDGMVGGKLGNYLSTTSRPVEVNGKLFALIRTDSPSTKFPPLPVSPTPVPSRRISWRELITE